MNNTNHLSMMQFQMPNRFALCENNVRNWKLFKQRLISYATITDLEKQLPQKQQAFFINLLENDALELFNSLSIPEDKSLTEIISIFDQHIEGKSNVTFERYKFNSRSQDEGEEFSSFLKDIQLLIKTCEYCTECKDSILKDKIVLGVNDSQLQRELLKINDLSLTKAIEI